MFRPHYRFICSHIDARTSECVVPSFFLPSLCTSSSTARHADTAIYFAIKLDFTGKDLRQLTLDVEDTVDSRHDFDASIRTESHCRKHLLNRGDFHSRCRCDVVTNVRPTKTINCIGSQTINDGKTTRATRSHQQVDGFSFVRCNLVESIFKSNDQKVCETERCYSGATEWILDLEIAFRVENREEKRKYFSPKWKFAFFSFFRFSAAKCNALWCWTMEWNFGRREFVWFCAKHHKTCVVVGMLETRKWKECFFFFLSFLFAAAHSTVSRWKGTKWKLSR